MIERVLRLIHRIADEQTAGLLDSALATWQELAELLEEVADAVIVSQIAAGKVSPVNPRELVFDIEDAANGLLLSGLEGRRRADILAVLWVAKNAQSSNGWQLRVGSRSYRIAERMSYRS